MVSDTIASYPLFLNHSNHFEIRRCFMLCSYPKLETEKIEKIQALEKEIGKTMIAVSYQAVSPSALTDEQISKIKELEESTGMVLIAVEV